MRLFSRIFGTDEQLERADRRAFLRGMLVTSAGLVVPGREFFLPLPPKFRIDFIHVETLPTITYDDAGLKRVTEACKQVVDRWGELGWLTDARHYDCTLVEEEILAIFNARGTDRLPDT